MSYKNTFQLNPTYGAPLDARMVGTVNDRPSMTRSYTGLLRYETDNNQLYICTNTNGAAPVYQTVASTLPPGPQGPPGPKGDTGDAGPPGPPGNDASSASNFVGLSQAAYDALETPDSATLYIIV